MCSHSKDKDSSPSKVQEGDFVDVSQRRFYDSTTSHAALGFLEEAVYSIVSWRGDAFDWLAKATQADPFFSMPHILKVIMLGFSKHLPADDADTKEVIKVATRCVEEAKGKRKKAVEEVEEGDSVEELYLRAALAVWGGRVEEAADLFSELLSVNPLDVLALQMFMFSWYYMGRPGEAGRLLVLYEKGFEGSRYYPHVLADCGNVLMDNSIAMGTANDKINGEGEGDNRCLKMKSTMDVGATYARKGIALEKNNAWGIHAMAHYYENKGEHAEGLDFLNGLEEEWSSRPAMKCHVGWHRCLFYLETDQPGLALKTFREKVFPLVEWGLVMNCVDAASFLMRYKLFCELEELEHSQGRSSRGEDGLRAEDIREEWAKLTVLVEPGMKLLHASFHDLHFVMATSAHYHGTSAPSVKENSLSNPTEAHLQQLAKYLADPNGQAKHGVSYKTFLEFGYGMAKAIELMMAGEYEHAAECFRKGIEQQDRKGGLRMGGSFAQQDVNELMYVYCLVRSNDALHRSVIAPNVIKNRLRTKPKSKMNSMLKAVL
eukprot:Nk52_evm57s212 gene=Nk52_evmTU57s212